MEKKQVAKRKTHTNMTMPDYEPLSVSVHFPFLNYGIISLNNNILVRSEINRKVRETFSIVLRFK